MGRPLVVLLRGISGVGKSVLAAALARRLGLSLLMADDICLVLQRGRRAHCATGPVRGATELLRRLLPMKDCTILGLNPLLTCLLPYPAARSQ
jgi:serine kinase of HPr protein (carbohydrate metabolism regulator)